MRRVVFLVALVAVPAMAQDRAATQRRLNALRGQIASVERQVQQARGQEATAVEAVRGMDAEIQLREQLVSGYRTQIGTIQGETQTLRRSIERLEGEIDRAKESYRRRARHAYVHGRRNSLALILAAGSVNQMLVRARYLRQFAGRRRDQVDRIAQKSGELRGREQEVRQSLEETQRLLQQGQAEQQELAQSRREREALVTELRGKRGRLERDLQQRKTDAQQLAAVVQDLVAQERRRAEAERQQREAAARAQAEAQARAEAARQAEAARVAEAERRAAETQRRADEAARRAQEVARRRTEPAPRQAEPSASAPVAEARPAPRAETPAAARPEPPRPTVAARPEPARPAPARPAAPAVDRVEDLTGSFRQNRGRLPWPVDGTVTGRFGTRTDPVYNTQTSSPGIDISASAGSPARAVYQGVVQRVGTIPTYGTYVMVTHGEFVTLYGNLSQVVVSQGQQVRAGQVVGRAGTADERRGAQLFFALYQGGTAVDPLGWLRGR